jgi:hypothetical protein
LKGSQIIQELQALAGIDETDEQAERGWNAMSEWEKSNTVAAHKVLLGRGK